MISEFTLGGALALVAPALRRLPAAGPVSAIASLAAVLAVVFGPMGHGTLAWSGAAVLACLAGLLAEDRLPWHRLSPLLWLGEISYALYLSHDLVLGPLARVVLGWVDLPATITGVAFLVAVLVAAIALAALFYRTIERPARQALGRLAVRRFATVDS